MKTKTNTHIKSNVQFQVTKKVTNSNGFLHPHILFERLQVVATYPIQQYYTDAVPNATDYTFKMRKNAFLNDRLTLQTQLIKEDSQQLKVNIIVSKSKKNSKTEETISSAVFCFPLQKKMIVKAS